MPPSAMVERGSENDRSRGERTTEGFDGDCNIGVHNVHILFKQSVVYVIILFQRKSIRMVNTTFSLSLFACSVLFCSGAVGLFSP